jgi:RHS repeat-associated protein
MVMAGISSKAAGKGLDCGCGNKEGYNGNEIQTREFSDGNGLDVYDFNARIYDKQIGRFHQIDPLADQESQESLSPYHFTNNNPIRFNDPDGKCPWCLPFIVGAAIDFAMQGVELAAGTRKEIDIWQVGISGVSAAIGVGAASKIASAFSKGGVVGEIAAEAATDFTVNVGQQILTGNGEISITDAAINAVIGQTVGRAASATVKEASGVNISENAKSIINTEARAAGAAVATSGVASTLLDITQGKQKETNPKTIIPENPANSISNGSKDSNKEQVKIKSGLKQAFQIEYLQSNGSYGPVQPIKF